MDVLNSKLFYLRSLYTAEEIALNLDLQFPVDETTRFFCNRFYGNQTALRRHVVVNATDTQSLIDECTVFLDEFRRARFTGRLCFQRTHSVDDDDDDDDDNVVHCS